MPEIGFLIHYKKGFFMPVITDIQTISETIGDIINFAETSDKTKEDFEEYLKTIGAKDVSPSKLQALCIPYITERIIFKENKTVPELYIEDNPNLTDLEKEITIGLNNSVSSIFEIKKRLNNGFVMYNFVNEKTYTVVPLVKMTNLREVCPSQYALVRIFKFKDTYFMLEISNVIPSYEKESVLNFAVAKIVEKPEDLYFDNEEKFKEVKTYVEKSVNDFKEFFGKNEVITTNKQIDNLVDLFDKYQKTGEQNLKSEIDSYIETLPELKYMNISEFSNSYDTFMQKSLQGFSSHVEIYDVCYTFDEELGVYIIPFWATLCKIFTSDNYKEIENYKDCVMNFIKNDKIPPSFLYKLAEKTGSKEGFEARLQEIIEEKTSIEEIVKKYKGEYLKKTIFSSANALYCSKTFASIVEK